VNVHIEDMRAGVHEHLMFGEGEMRFPPIIEALARAHYRGGLHVELSRHSHEAPAAARKAYAFLQPLLDRAEPG
jgi:L-ribulose-5-phosphate 3-epimerase